MSEFHEWMVMVTRTRQGGWKARFIVHAHDIETALWSAQKSLESVNGTWEITSIERQDS